VSPTACTRSGSRKAAKQLRYTTEVVRPALGKPAARFAKGLKGVQQALGEHQDTVVARETLRELGAQADNGFSFGLLHGQGATRTKKLRRRLA
jgi:CHAD domain-containing protein